MTLRRALGTVVAVGLLVLIAAPPSPAQSPDITTLQADVAKLKKDLEGVQRDLQEIKTLLRRAGAMPEEFKSIALGLGDGPFKGASDARVTLVEFTDYQCPFCARHQKETVPQLLEKYVKTGKLKYVVRDFPLEHIHPAAVKAAEAPHCAADNGKYWEMQERLFANPKSITPADLVAHAEALGLDSKAFKACMESGKYTPRVNQARVEGERAGVRGTPTFFIGITDANSDKITAVAAIRGAHPFAKFQDEIEKLLISPK
jgi:protein-disulfide isomerase